MAEEPVQPQAPAAAVTADMLRAAVDLVRGIGFILTNTTFYGPRHNVTVQSVCAAAALAESFHKRFGPLHLDLSGGQFLIAATPLGDRATNTEALRTRMLALDARELVLQPGVTADELARFATLLFTPEAAATVAGGFTGLMRQAAFEHIRSAAYVYQRVAGDEEVVKKGEAAGGLARQMAGRIGKFLAGEAGEAGADNPLGELSADEEELNGVLREAFVAQEGAGATPESRAEHAATWIRKVSDGLLANRANRTQKGRRAVKRLLGTLGEAVQEHLREQGDDGQVTAAVAAAVQEVAEDLEIDGLATKYARQLAGSDASEKRLQRQIRRMSGDAVELGALHDKLTESGLPEDVWQSLLARCGMDGAGQAVTPEALGELLRRLDRLLPPAGAAPAAAPDAVPAEAGRVLREVSRHVAAASVRAETRIRDAFREGPALSRQRLVEIFAELGQELCQPLTVLNASIEMVQQQRVGPLNECQAEMLGAVLGDLARMEGLIKRLVALVGMPKTTQPDRGILDTP